LELGCGEGADALWLAGQGWQVDGLDISCVALERAAARAVELGLDDRVHWQEVDLFEWRAEPRYDLVSAQFLQSHDVDTLPILVEASRAVAPGGTLLIVAHESVPHWSGLAGESPLPTAAELADAVGLRSDHWRVELIDAVERVAAHADGRAHTIADGIIRAIRL
jgi:SAM-dependent methyltransferase